MFGFFLLILAEHIAHCTPGEDYQGAFQKSIGAARRVLVPRAAVPALQIYKAKLQMAATGVQGDWVFALYTGGLFMTTNRPSSLKNCVCDTKCAPISDRELFEIPEIILSM